MSHGRCQQQQRQTSLRFPLRKIKPTAPAAPINVAIASAAFKLPSCAGRIISWEVVPDRVRVVVGTGVGNCDRTDKQIASAGFIDGCQDLVGASVLSFGATIS